MTRRTFEETIGPLVAGLVLLVTLIGVLGTATHDPRAHEIPVGLSAPPALAQQLTSAFAVAAPGAFAFTIYDSEAGARAALDTRATVAALVVGSGGPRLIVAGAAGDAVTGVVAAAFTGAFRAQATALTVEVVHPFQSGDAHGIGLFFLVLAVLLSTVIATAMIAVRGRHQSTGVQLGTAVAYAGLAGIVGALATAWIVDGYGDKLWQVMALAALLSLAVGSVTLASARAFGPPGIALAALVVVLLGLVSSGGPLGSELLPDAYRALAPWMPPGQASNALRGALYFDGAGVAYPVLVLAVWAAAGLAATAIAATVHPSPRPTIAAAA